MRLYREIGGVQAEQRDTYRDGGIFQRREVFYKHV
jgi:hypothetical protein